MRRPLTKDIDLTDKTLIIKHTWGVGDILYSTPAVHALKQKFKGLNLIYVSTHPEILENNPDVDENIHFMDAGAYADLMDSMEDDWYWLDYDTPLKGGYDYKVNLRTKPMLNEFLVSLLRKNPNQLEGDEKDFVNQASSSVISRYRMVALDMYCWHAFVDPVEKSVHYYPTEHELAMAKKFLQPLRNEGYKVITLMPHSSTIYKDYPHWAEVVKLCPSNYYWLVLDSQVRKDENWIGPNQYNLGGAFQIRQTAALVIESDLNCSSDTGLLYPKVARGGKAVVTYGPHEPEPFLHYFPSAHGLRVSHVTGLLPDGKESCSVGCYIDVTSCKPGGGNAPCLEQLSPQVVADKIKELLEK